ncbi:Glycosyltransferase involved in cell wall bisynthesis [Nonlabens sp. Hel1_33_55]|uniref:glycosyltransferase family 2 protein n=1 Tax=Nonlabens sp. Hel1_33_55 TaxID=1336802 RepID=UPI000875ED63|nr:glycosyltransferase family 2 protein [Nonlabens sp. Hel1_33_55]SCX92338.1 Glycosyltransferase involved in cell wall bisynthesis [Nonlabens sp. Hel1_33_55]
MLSEQLISVIIPCYNQASFLNETLESVYEQSYADWECIIVNDGSTDNTQQIAERWVKKDVRFKYYFQDNSGLSAARNKGLKESRGDFIQLLDSDDLINKEKFEVQLNEIKESDVSICNYFPFMHENPLQKAPYRYLPPFLAPDKLLRDLIIDWEYRKSFPPHCVLFRASLVKDNALSFVEDLPNHEDWVFWVMLFHSANSIKQTSSILAKYRIHSNSMSTNFHEMRAGFLQATDFLENYFLKMNEVIMVRLIRIKRKEIKARQNRKTSPLWNLAKRYYRKIKSRFVG